MGVFNNIFGKKNEITLFNDFANVAVDMHSHLIPGIDDGSQSFEESIEMIKKFSDLGYTKLITTPHIINDSFKNSPETILPKLDSLKLLIEEQKIPIRIEAAAEYYFDYEFQANIGKKPLMTFGDNYVLFEISFFNPPEGLNETIFNLAIARYKPVLAHVERYPYWFNKFSNYTELKDRGILFQMNINSVIGAYGSETKKIAEKLIDNDLIDFIGSDAHHMSHLNNLHEAQKNKHLHKLIESDRLLNKKLL